ncbi:DUF4886 domain-containing protein [Robertkochia sediminum]|uniref:DUF4886 domain-containing protein n=1 Tax=Robertkochia sediminum TaxID=2785326 RepID=UPI00193135FE|nr:DUF4886 domain-containing protein [Robertkochia sediminum]MBL7471419.1 hypothetical protein [Robertkochia sediminum]
MNKIANMISRIQWIILLLTLGLASLSVSAQDNEEERVLFIGNSFTFFWNTPQLVEAMAKDQGVNLDAFQSTVGGSHLKQHWEGEKNTQTRKRLEEESWSRVIIQDHSTSTIAHTERFREYAGKFIDLVREKQAEPVLFLTWAYDSNPVMQPEITEEYLKLGKEKGVRVIPAGMVWEQARNLRPDLDLFFDDKHQTPEGTYLNALLIYKTLTGRSVAEIPNRLSVITADGEKLYLTFILPENGKFLRDLVERFDVANTNFSN